MRARTLGQLIADAELSGVHFRLVSIERHVKSKRLYTVTSVVNNRLASDESIYYLFRLESIGRTYVAYATVRTDDPLRFSFETEYDWSDLRELSPNVHDHGRLQTKMRGKP